MLAIKSNIVVVLFVSTIAINQVSAFDVDNASDYRLGAPSCSPYYRHYIETDACYRFYPITTMWATAERFCKTDGGHLVSIHSETENNIVTGLSMTKSDQPIWTGIWIGLSWDIASNFWRWSDGTPLNYNKWIIAHSEGSAKYPCVAMHPDKMSGTDTNYTGGWAHCVCANGYHMWGFVCKHARIEQP